jgi:hypothetical protein
MGTGDEVPDAIEALGVPAPAHQRRESLPPTSPRGTSSSSASAPTPPGPNSPPPSRASTSLSSRGGTLIVLYQSGNFPAPLPLSMGRAERVVDESSPRQAPRPRQSPCSPPQRHHPRRLRRLGRRARPLLPRILGPRLHRPHRNRRPRPGPAARRPPRRPSRQRHLHLRRLRPHRQLPSWSPAPTASSPTCSAPAQGQIDGLKSDLAAKDAALKQAQQAAADAQAAAAKAEQDATSEQQAVTENAAAVTTLQSTVTDLKGNQVSLATTVSDETAKIKKAIDSPASCTTRESLSSPRRLHGGRNRLPHQGHRRRHSHRFQLPALRGRDAYSLSEFYGSARQSRVSLNV